MGNNLLSAKAPLPDYDRKNLAPRINNLGYGAFHRAHQGVYADILATEHFSDWGYYEVYLIGGEQQIADLQQQDNQDNKKASLISRLAFLILNFQKNAAMCRNCCLLICLDFFSCP